MSLFFILTFPKAFNNKVNINIYQSFLISLRIMLQIVKIYLLVLIRQNCYFLLEYILEAKSVRMK